MPSPSRHAPCRPGPPPPSKGGVEIGRSTDEESPDSSYACRRHENELLRQPRKDGAGDRFRCTLAPWDGRGPAALVAQRRDLSVTGKKLHRIRQYLLLIHIRRGIHRRIEILADTDTKRSASPSYFAGAARRNEVTRARMRITRARMRVAVADQAATGHDLSCPSWRGDRFPARPPRTSRGWVRRASRACRRLRRLLRAVPVLPRCHRGFDTSPRV